jgi:ubiquinone/menaquinone biosynthesis C-methylase UbiE
MKGLALVSGDPDQLPPDGLKYYLDAEKATDDQWRTIIWPMIKGLDFSVCLDLAAGYGRHSAQLLQQGGQVIVVDINQPAIDFCRERFKGNDKVRCLLTDGYSLKGVEDKSVTLVFSFDAMVHFDSDVVRAYLQEFTRILRPGGSCFIHHSNFTGDPAGDIDRVPHRRNFMSRELMAHYALKSGLTVTRQQLLDWSEPKLDCLTILRKPSR